MTLKLAGDDNKKLYAKHCVNYCFETYIYLLTHLLIVVDMLCPHVHVFKSLLKTINDTSCI